MTPILAALWACAPPKGTPPTDGPPPGDGTPTTETAAHTGVGVAGHSAAVATGDTGAAPFEVWFRSEPAGDAMAVRTSVPADEAGCAAVPGAPCGDLDLDGLVDAWEAGLLEELRPSLVFDEEEPLVDDPAATLAIVARVAPVSVDAVHVFLVLAYAIDYGRCGLSGHDGDTERAVLEVVRDGGVGDVRVTAVYTAAHEGTPNDHGETFTGARLAALSFPPDPDDAEPRLQLFSSDGKHATYGTLRACESASLVPCVEEDCGPDGVDPARFTAFPPVFDAGEPDAPRLTDLGPIGFPNEDAWVDQDFCGGRGRGWSCSAPVREKLLDDPL